MKYQLLVCAFVCAMATGATASEIVGNDGKVLRVSEPQKKGFPSPRTYTKFYGMMGKDSVFVSKNGKYCLIKVSPKTGKEYAKWLKVE